MKKSKLKNIIRDCINEEQSKNDKQYDLQSVHHAVNNMISTLNKNVDVPGQSEYLRASIAFRKFILRKNKKGK